MIRPTIILALIGTLFAGDVFALYCTKTGSTCVDSTPCKKIGGIDVCLTDPEVNATCWKYQDTYECTEQKPLNYCKAINAMPGCRQTGSTCTTPGASPGSCLKWKQTYRCGSSTLPASQTVTLTDSHTLVTAMGNPSRCANPSDNPTCTIAEKTPQGNNYSCLSIESNCNAQSTSGCTKTASTCVNPGPTASNCLVFEHTYSCSTGTPSTVLDCGNRQYCVDGNCFDASYTPDQDLASVVTAHEIGRQITTYMDSATQTFFAGKISTCKQNNAWHKCCDPKGGAIKNRSLGGKIKSTVGRQAILSGSKYVYDAMYQGYQAYRGMSAMAATASYAGAAATSAAASATFSMSTYGLTVNYSAATGFQFGFDPTSLAAAVAIMVVVELTSCDQTEQDTAMKVGAGLCRQIGSEGVSCFLGSCAYDQRTFCCFNSKLARILNSAAVAQGLRGPADCSGMTMDEFNRIDLSKVDFSEFTAEITSSITPLDMVLCNDGTSPQQGICADGSTPISKTQAINTDVGLSANRKLQNYQLNGVQ